MTTDKIIKLGVLTFWLKKKLGHIYDKDNLKILWKWGRGLLSSCINHEHSVGCLAVWMSWLSGHCCSCCCSVRELGSLLRSMQPAWMWPGRKVFHYWNIICCLEPKVLYTPFMVSKGKVRHNFTLLLIYFRTETRQHYWYLLPIYEFKKYWFYGAFDISVFVIGI